MTINKIKSLVNEIDYKKIKPKTIPTFSGIKDASASVLILLSTFLVATGVYKSTTTDSISFEPLQVPNAFVDKGYTPQISTTRLVDEIRKINTTATTTKSRSAISGKQPGEELTKINPMPLPVGIDIHAIQGIIRDLLGTQSRSINGDITISGDSKDNKYFVRVRQSPENHLLVDEIVVGEPDEVLKVAALKIIESIDPVVAASYYRNKKNIPEALRMVDLALTNDKVEDDTFALSQRAQIYQGQKKYALSKADLDTLLSLDANSPQGLGVQSYWYNEQGFYKEGLQYAEKQMKVRPDMWHAYFNKADSLIGLKLDAEKEFLEGIKNKPNKGWAYVDAAEYLEKKGKTDIANSILKQGVGRFPNSIEVNLAYGKKMLKEGHLELAFNYLKRAYQIAPDDKKVWESLFLSIPKGKEDDLRKDLEAKLNSTIKPSKNTNY
jgi:tetratricopeptide (TPR) repeat protein